jgi:phosphate acetyltransferase
LNLIETVREKTSRNLKRIVLPESDEQRTIEAIDMILKKNIAKIILIGKDEVKDKINTRGSKNLDVIEPGKYRDIEKVIGEYYELRKAKGLTPDEARETITKDYLYFGAMLVRQGLADGFVAGASHTTADVIRSALRCIPIDRTIGTVAGAFVIEVPDSLYGEKGVFVFADCGVIPEPTSRQLAGIAVSSAMLFEQLVGKPPKVAFLSYSSKGSAAGPLVDKIREALAACREISPGLLVDGEFQADSAIVPEVAKLKCSASEVAGKANVLIFPDLNSGNISYKLVQRLAKARAVGPLLLGFTKPVSDLSRGCSAEDIVDAVAMTAVRSSC